MTSDANVEPIGEDLASATARIVREPLEAAALETMAKRFGLSPETLRRLELELRNSRKKFPGNEHKLAALTEEVGEAAQALLEYGNGSEARAELVQVATVALRIMEEGCGDFPSEGSERTIVLGAEDMTHTVGEGAVYWVPDMGGVTRVKLRRLESGWALVGEQACPERGRGPIWPVEKGQILAPFYTREVGAIERALSDGPMFRFQDRSEHVRIASRLLGWTEKMRVAAVLLKDEDGPNHSWCWKRASEVDDPNAPHWPLYDLEVWVEPPLKRPEPDSIRPLIEDGVVEEGEPRAMTSEEPIGEDLASATARIVREPLLETMAKRLGLSPETLRRLELELRNSRKKFPGRAELVQVATVALRIMEEGCGDFPSEGLERTIVLHADDATRTAGEGAVYWVPDLDGVTRATLRRFEGGWVRGWALVGEKACPEQGRGPIWPVEKGQILAPFYTREANAIERALADGPEFEFEVEGGSPIQIHSRVHGWTEKGRELRAVLLKDEDGPNHSWHWKHASEADDPSAPHWPLRDVKVWAERSERTALAAEWDGASAWHVNFAERTLRPATIEAGRAMLHARFAGMAMPIPVETDTVFRTVDEAAKALEDHMERVGEQRRPAGGAS